ncbi:MAG TPA: trypsin-like peptidase domain-containing protein [Luteimonas sp.]|nr:trypsin-like peptidase domain-containing protein [Luteimonas sp.]
MVADVSILKTLWIKSRDGRWEISGLKGLALKPKPGSEVDYFAIAPEFELMTSSPMSETFLGLLQSFGHTDLLLQQSILPVVAFMEGARTAKCIGTAFVVSCSGYVITASHVLMDPHDSGYAKLTLLPQGRAFEAGLNMGVIVPVNPASGREEAKFLPFERARYWGDWKQSPLLYERERLEMFTDIAVCKVAELPNGMVHQPLNLSLRPFADGETTYTIGYAEMEDFPIDIAPDGRLTTPSLRRELYVSVGETKRSYPQNHLIKEVPTPGPCFNYKAKVPGKMSGAPIFGGDGAVVRGVVSRSFSGERDAYGAMLSSIIGLPVTEGRSLLNFMTDSWEGMPRLDI